jgi:hypothetical protein
MVRTKISTLFTTVILICITSAGCSYGNSVEIRAAIPFVAQEGVSYCLDSYERYADFDKNQYPNLRNYQIFYMNPNICYKLKGGQTYVALVDPEWARQNLRPWN